MRKDVLAKCYGGDVSRKKKLLKKQAKGKARMKVTLPHSPHLLHLAMTPALPLTVFVYACPHSTPVLRICQLYRC